MPDSSSVGQRFSQLIQQLGMSKNAFAMSLDKTATVIQHLVDERNKPGFDLMCKVFEVYPNVSKSWLLMGEGPMLLADINPPAIVADSSIAEPAVMNKPFAASATPHFPAPLFTVSTARPPAPEVSSPLAEPVASAPQEVAAAALPAAMPPVVSLPAAVAALGVVPPAPAATLPPASVPSTATPPAALDTATLTAALHAQYLQHQLALAEQRNQHLLEQQQLMQQMLDLMRQNR